MKTAGLPGAHDPGSRYAHREPVTVVLRGMVDAEWAMCGLRGDIPMLTVLRGDGMKTDVPDGSADVVVLRGLRGDLGSAALDAVRFATEWADLLAALPREFHATLTCDQADTAAALLRAAGFDEQAGRVIAEHARHDEPGDAHHPFAVGQ